MTKQNTSDTDIACRLEFELKFKKLVNLIHSAANVNALMVGVRDRILDLYDIEMATIFLIEQATRRLSSCVLLPGEHLRKIRIPMDSSSIAGHVSVSGGLLYIQDVQNRAELQAIDPKLRFDASWDEKGSVPTKQILAAPIKFKNSLLGVIQLINKRQARPFSESDIQRTN